MSTQPLHLKDKNGIPALSYEIVDKDKSFNHFSKEVISSRSKDKRMFFLMHA